MRNHFLILFVLLNYAGMAQTYPDESALENDWEQWQDKVPVSGHIRVGLMIDQTEEDFNPAEFYVVIPETDITNLCVELSSKDGRYSANINYDISALSAGIQQFVLPTKYKSELSDYTSNEVVILSSLNSDCNEDDDSKTFLLSGWVQNIAPDTVSVYVNLPAPTSLVAIQNDSTEHSFNCEVLKFPKVAYNKKCQMPIKVIETTIELVIKARVGRGHKAHVMNYEMPVKIVKF